jgi:cold shock protein
MAAGTVKSFDDAKGYGLIAPEDGEKDPVVHHTSIAGGGFNAATSVSPFALTETVGLTDESERIIGGSDAKRSFSHDRCVVCGGQASTTTVEDTNGWRWFNDGRGGLAPLCSTCPVPPDLLESTPPGATGATRPRRPEQPKPSPRECIGTLRQPHD